MPCQRKLPSTTRRLQNIIRTLRTITVKRPSTTTPDTMRRPHTTPIRREDTQLTPCITAKKRRRLTPRSTERNKALGAASSSPIASWRRSGLGDSRGPPTLAIGVSLFHLVNRRRLARTFLRYPLITERVVPPVATLTAASSKAVNFSATMRFASRTRGRRAT